MKSVAVHRLVMETFAEPSRLSVNHKNEDKSDNKLCNLEYMSPRENSRYSNARPVESYSLITGATRKRYKALIDVEKDGHDHGAVGHCCRGDSAYRSHHGLGWRYVA